MSQVYELDKRVVHLTADKSNVKTMDHAQA